MAQPTPDLGEVIGPADDVLGETVPPALRQLYGALGQNITREDVRIVAELNVSKADLGLMGLLVGSGKAEMQLDVAARLEMRVISSDRIRAALEGENAYNVSAENATFLSEAYIPAEVFRASATAEVLAAFQKDQEAALRRFVEQALPEMELLALDFGWRNVHPQQALGDLSLTEPPIVVEADAVLQLIRVESVPSLLGAYLEGQRSKTGADESREAYIERLKGENGELLRSRDFFAAAAYTQLVNLSMQPGWSLELDLRVPRGYSFTYCNRNVEPCGGRHVELRVDALEKDQQEHVVFLASLTHKRAVALALFGAMWGAALLVAAPLRWLHARRRRRA